jgi:hypothetical protein
MAEHDISSYYGFSDKIGFFALGADAQINAGELQKYFAPGLGCVLFDLALIFLGWSVSPLFLQDEFFSGGQFGIHVLGRHQNNGGSIFYADPSLYWVSITCRFTHLS